jgi:hypothetical protein
MRKRTISEMGTVKRRLDWILHIKLVMKLSKWNTFQMIGLVCWEK